MTETLHKKTQNSKLIEQTKESQTTKWPDGVFLYNSPILAVLGVPAIAYVCPVNDTDTIIKIDYIKNETTVIKVSEQEEQIK